MSVSRRVRRNALPIRWVFHAFWRGWSFSAWIVAYLSFECSRMGSVVISSMICFRSAAWVKLLAFMHMSLCWCICTLECCIFLSGGQLVSLKLVSLVFLLPHSLSATCECTKVSFLRQTSLWFVRFSLVSASHGLFWQQMWGFHTVRCRMRVYQIWLSV